MKMMRNPAAMMIVALALLLACSTDKNVMQPDRIKTVDIGGLFSISTNLAALGQDSKAAMELAIEDMNAVFAKNNRALRIAAVIEDTQLDPAKALTLLKAQAAKGITCVIGPSSSAEVEAVKSFADASNILVISHYSTAGRLAINDDNIFRFCPSDLTEGPAVAALCVLDGISAIVPLWRNDAGNQGLHDAVKAAFEAKGGTCASGYRYEPSTTDYAAAIAQIRSQVDQAIAQKGSAKVAVYAASFDEIVTIMKSVAADPVLSTIKWYCGDGVALNEPLLHDATASQVALQTRAESPNLSFDLNATAIWQPLEARIEAKTGNDGNPFSLAVYDAVCVLANTLAATEGSTANFSQFKQEFVKQANAYSGATGATVLNAAGDRKTGEYDFWRINKVGNTNIWVKSAYYDGQHDKASRL
jgi:branched-chain amino acid transport system substrate-binding protein